MPLLPRAVSLLRNLTRRGKIERELADEVSAYVDLLTRAKMNGGLSESAARRAALMHAGGAEQLKERVREVRMGLVADTVLHDLRYAARSLCNKPVFIATAVIALALGIGANTAMFSVINSVLLRSLPYADPEQLVMLSEHHASGGETTEGVSPANYREWLEQNRCFDEMAILSNGGRANISGTGEPEEIQVQVVTPSFFSVLGVPPMIGRLFAEDEGGRGRNRVVILSHSLWTTGFGTDPQIVGKPLTLNGENYEIVGVMPDGFRVLESQARLWAPTALDPAVNYRASSGRFMQGFARLKPGVTFSQAQAEMAQLAKRLEAAHPEFNGGWSVRLTPLHEAVVGEIKPLLIVLFATTAFVLLIACANVANLLLSRAAVRQKEFALRAALGATRTRLIRQVLMESALLALLGGAFGVLLAWWGIQLLVSFGPSDMPRLREIAVDPRALSFTCGVSLLTAVLSGLVPALHASRTDFNDALKQASRGSASGRSQALRNLFLVAEVALTVVLLIAAGLMTRSFLRLQAVDTGFASKNVLTLRLGLASKEFEKPHQIVAFFHEAEQRIASLPGVEAVGSINYLPIAGAGAATDFKIIGRPAQAPGELATTEVRVVTPSFFSAMEIPLLKGRLLDERDGRESRVLLISESLAKKFFPGEDPIGKQLIVNWEMDVADEIVGVVGDIKETALADETKPMIYWPHARVAHAKMALIVRASTDATALVMAAERQIRALQPDQPIDARTMESVVFSSIAPPRFNTLLLSIFAAVALVLASVGLYGVMNYSATQRTHEVGIRMALGATRADIMKLVVGNGMLLTLTGIGIGVVASIGLTRVMQSFLFGVGATDAVTFIAVSALLITVALIANYIPARKATRVNPVIALRYE